MRIRDVGKFNIALWKWRFGIEFHGLWKEILESKYGLRRNTNLRAKL